MENAGKTPRMRRERTFDPQIHQLSGALMYMPVLARSLYSLHMLRDWRVIESPMPWWPTCDELEQL